MADLNLLYELYLSDELTTQQQKELRHLLADSENRSQFERLCRDFALIDSEINSRRNAANTKAAIQGALFTQTPSRKKKKRRQKKKTRSTLPWITAIAASIAVATLLILNTRAPEIPAARITSSFEADFDKPVKSEIKGNSSHRLKKGAVTLKLQSGSSVTLEAPARFTLTGRNSLNVDKGRLTAIIPEQAKGFTIKTPQGTITDLGTVFSTELTSNQTFTQCESGEILASRGEQSLNLKEREAATISKSILPAAFRPGAFTIAIPSAAQRKIWEETRRRLLKAPECLSFYELQAESCSNLKNKSEKLLSHNSQIAAGLLPGSDSLATTPQSQLQFNIPSDSEEFTLMMRLWYHDTEDKTLSLNKLRIPIKGDWYANQYKTNKAEFFKWRRLIVKWKKGQPVKVIYHGDNSTWLKNTLKHHGQLTVSGFYGKIAEVALLSQYLSDQEIRTLMPRYHSP